VHAVTDPKVPIDPVLQPPTTTVGRDLGDVDVP
jgi:hypothetical protein